VIARTRSGLCFVVWRTRACVGAGVLEYRIDFGPGYRVYFGRDGDSLVILLAGGTKRRQQHDIATAQVRWADYKKRRKKEK
jgi:putative addiction module killer protein